MEEDPVILYSEIQEMGLGVKDMLIVVLLIYPHP